MAWCAGPAWAASAGALTGLALQPAICRIRTTESRCCAGMTPAGATISADFRWAALARQRRRRPGNAGELCLPSDTQPGAATVLISPDYIGAKCARSWSAEAQVGSGLFPCTAPPERRAHAAPAASKTDVGRGARTRTAASLGYPAMADAVGNVPAGPADGVFGGPRGNRARHWGRWWPSRRFSPTAPPASVQGRRDPSTSASDLPDPRPSSGADLAEAPAGFAGGTRAAAGSNSHPISDSREKIGDGPSLRECRWPVWRPWRGPVLVGALPPVEL